MSKATAYYQNTISMSKYPITSTFLNQLNVRKRKRKSNKKEYKSIWIRYCVVLSAVFSVIAWLSNGAYSDFNSNWCYGKVLCQRFYIVISISLLNKQRMTHFLASQTFHFAFCFPFNDFSFYFIAFTNFWHKFFQRTNKRQPNEHLWQQNVYNWHLGLKEMPIKTKSSWLTKTVWRSLRLF